jgi:hypothetical protein
MTCDAELAARAGQSRRAEQGRDIGVRDPSSASANGCPLAVCCSRLLLLRRDAPGVVVIVSCQVGSVASRQKHDACLT